MMAQQETDFVIFDVETTGLSPLKGARIIEVAGVRLKNLKPAAYFHSLINPRCPVSYGAFMVNGITDEMLAGAPFAEDVLPEFIRFSGDACLVGHNVRFDLRFLGAELRRMNHPFFPGHGVLDTVKMAKRLFPEVGRYSLLSVARFLEVGDDQRHRALADVELTVKVFCRLLEAADRKDICDREALLKHFSVTTDNLVRRWPVAV